MEGYGKPVEKPWPNESFTSLMEMYVKGLLHFGLKNYFAKLWRKFYTLYGKSSQTDY